MTALLRGAGYEFREGRAPGAPELAEGAAQQRIALVLLGVLFKQAADRDFLRIASISLVVSGAIGNLWDRVRWDLGVVDFIGPIDLGFWDFPIFNVADMAITCGAVLLAISFWFEEQMERRLEAASAAAGAPTAPPTAPPNEPLAEEPSA